MSLEWFCSAVVAAVGTTLLGHFGEGLPRSKRLSKWAVYFGATALISKTAGRPWTLVWILGLPGIGAIFHVWWCRRHGIDPLTAEPRDEYYRLRGWTG